MNHIREKLKAKYPGLWRRTYDEKSRSAAIQLFCRECIGDQMIELKECSDKTCPLYQFRLGSKTAIFDRARASKTA